MSFAYEAKQEILKSKIEGDTDCIAFLSAVIKCAGVIGLVKGKKILEIYTEVTNLYEKINAIIKQYYGAECELEVIEDSLSDKFTRYKITIPEEVSNEILNDTGIMKYQDDILQVNNGIDEYVINEDSAKIAYIKGAFIACATSNIVIKNYNNNTRASSGYHLEFVFSFDKLAEDFVKLLSYFNIKAKITVRKNNPLVYIKEYQLICDTLALVEAVSSVLKLQNEAAIRDLRNNVNRQTNCINANLNKTVNASVKQLNAIKIIQDTVGIESLEDNLQELCLLRLANPDESLDSLKNLYSCKISKSGINHRLNKIISIAENIKGSKIE